MLTINSIIDKLQDIVIGVFSNFVFFCIGFIFSKLRFFFGEQKIYKKLLRLKSDRDISIILPIPTRMSPGATSTNPSNGVPLLPPGPIFALSHLSSIIGLAYKNGSSKLHIYYADNVPTERLKGNIFCIGLPKVNAITRQIMDSVTETPVTFNDHEFIERKSLNTLFRALVIDHKVTHDYGCITRIRNPFDTNNIAFIFVGSQTYGVTMASSYIDKKYATDLLYGTDRNIIIRSLLNIKFLESIMIRISTPLHSNYEYQCIIEGDIVDGETMSTRICYYKRFNTFV